MDPESLTSFLACRLIPLEKGENDVRPIGIGETLRRIVGKALFGRTFKLLAVVSKFAQALKLDVRRQSMRCVPALNQTKLKQLS